MASNQLQPIPRKYRPAVNVKWAKLLKTRPPWIKRVKARGRFAVGNRYEQTVHDHLSLLALAKPHLEYYEGQWIEFFDDNGKRWCQLDGLMLDRSQRAAIIIEVKYQHTADAWWQLTQLYLPVIRKALPEIRPVCMLEIVHWFDPATEFPDRFDLTDHPFRIPHANKVAVHIFNPKRRRPAHSGSDGLALDGHNDSQGDGQAVGPIGLSQGAK